MALRWWNIYVLFFFFSSFFHFLYFLSHTSSIYCNRVDFNHCCACAIKWFNGRSQHWMGVTKWIMNSLNHTGHNVIDNRAIATAWVVIVTSAIPAALSHGVVNYPYAGRNYTACLFLVEEGYNLVAFQVNDFSFF